MSMFREGTPEEIINPESREKEPKPSIRLEFFRHDDKEKGEVDEEIRLTPKGRKHATEAGKEKGGHPETALAYGSIRDRSLETAYRQMAASKNEFSPDDTLEDIRESIGDELKVGKKEVMTPKLDYNVEGSEAYNTAAYHRFLGKKDTLRFMYEDSDKLVRQELDTDSTTLSRNAGDIAELISRYVKMLPNWDRIAKANPEKYADNGNELQRFMGSHQTVTENFLMKVLEKNGGQEAVMKFIEELEERGLGNGFDFSEGYSVIIDPSPEPDGQPSLTITYRDTEIQATPEMLDEIIAERDALNLEIEQAKANKMDKTPESI